MQGTHQHIRRIQRNRGSNLLFVILCGLVFGIWHEAAFAQPRPLTVAILQPYDLKEYHEAVAGFLDALQAQTAQDVHPIFYESANALTTTLRKAAQTQPQIDLVLSVGTEATLQAAQTIVDIPTVFTMVLDPANLVNLRPDLAGAAINIPVKLQFTMLSQILPSVKTLGVLYDPQWNTEFIEESRLFAQGIGFQIQAIPVRSAKEISNALAQLSTSADALWGITDKTVYTSQTASFIIKDTAIKYKLPFIGLSESYVKAGALYAISIDPREIGRQSAGIASQILSGVYPAQRVTLPENIRLAVNLRTAKLLGISFPEYIVNNADTVYE